MAEPQPWRNPRPTPSLAEIRARTPAPRALAWLRDWWPAIVWAGVIFVMSTDTFSAEHTASVVERIVHWLKPGTTHRQFEAIHRFIRKSAHFTEYFTFCLLIYRAVRGGRKGWRWTWGVTALFYAAVYSALDEIHQAFVASRTASIYDSLLDSVGAFVAMSVLWLWFRFRRSGASAVTPASDPAS